MKLQKVEKILSAIRTIVGRGEHFQWAGLTHIASETQMNRQTVWRYLKELEASGHVYKVKKTWRGEVAYRYYMTKEGKKLLSSFQYLPTMGDPKNG